MEFKGCKNCKHYVSKTPNNKYQMARWNMYLKDPEKKIDVLKGSTWVYNRYKHIHEDHERSGCKEFEPSMWYKFKKLFTQEEI